MRTSTLVQIIVYNYRLIFHRGITPPPPPQVSIALGSFRQTSLWGRDTRKPCMQSFYSLGLKTESYVMQSTCSDRQTCSKLICKIWALLTYTGNLPIYHTCQAVVLQRTPDEFVASSLYNNKYAHACETH